MKKKKKGKKKKTKRKTFRNNDSIRIKVIKFEEFFEEFTNDSELYLLKLFNKDKKLIKEYYKDYVNVKRMIGELKKSKVIVISIFSKDSINSYGITENGLKSVWNRIKEELFFGNGKKPKHLKKEVIPATKIVKEIEKKREVDLFSTLPNELFIEIFTFLLNEDDLFSISYLNKFFFSFFKSEIFWRVYCKEISKKNSNELNKLFEQFQSWQKVFIKKIRSNEFFLWYRYKSNRDTYSIERKTEILSISRDGLLVESMSIDGDHAWSDDGWSSGNRSEKKLTKQEFRRIKLLIQYNYLKRTIIEFNDESKKDELEELDEYTKIYGIYYKIFERKPLFSYVELIGSEKRYMSFVLCYSLLSESQLSYEIKIRNSSNVINYISIFNVGEKFKLQKGRRIEERVGKKEFVVKEKASISKFTLNFSFIFCVNKNGKNYESKKLYKIKVDLKKNPKFKKFVFLE